MGSSAIQTGGGGVFNGEQVRTPHAAPWVKRDDVAHNVTATDQTFGSEPLDIDGNSSFHITVPGTYRYFCLLHPRMTAEITVQSARGALS